jgi:hypothetical protein
MRSTARPPGSTASLDPTAGAAISPGRETHSRATLLNASQEPLQRHWHAQIKAPQDQDRARPDGG